MIINIAIDDDVDIDDSSIDRDSWRYAMNDDDDWRMTTTLQPLYI